VSSSDDCALPVHVYPSLSRGVLNVSPFILHGGDRYLVSYIRSDWFASALEKVDFLQINSDLTILLQNRKGKFCSKFHDLPNYISFISVHINLLYSSYLYIISSTFYYDKLYYFKSYYFHINL